MSRHLSIFLTLILFLAAGSAVACSCITPSLGEAVERADSVFLGTVVSLATMDGRKLVVLEVERSWKGDDSGEAHVVTEIDNGNCGVLFLPGESWVVFATDTDWPAAGWSYTHLCTLDAPAETPYGRQIIENLDALPAEDTAWGTLKARFR